VAAARASLPAIKRLARYRIPDADVVPIMHYYEFQIYQRERGRGRC
jgi:hypothetical protein